MYLDVTSHMQSLIRQPLSVESAIWHSSRPLPRRNIKTVMSVPTTDGDLFMK